MDEFTEPGEAQIAPSTLPESPPRAAHLAPLFTSETGRLYGKLGGRPVSVERYMRRLLRQRGPDRKRNAQNVAQALLDKACDGNLDAIKLVLDRIDGPLIQKAVTEHIETRKLVISPKRAQPRVIELAPAQPDAWTDGTDEPAS